MYQHTPVLQEEIGEFLQPKKGQIFIDCTLGGGGHTIVLAKKIAPTGKILALDIDQKAIENFLQNVCKNLEPEVKKCIKAVEGDYSELAKIVKKNGFNKVDGIIADLGFSSYHIEGSGKGFSFLRDEDLDMRYGHSGKSAKEIVNRSSVEDLTMILSEFGEEPLAWRIAEKIVEDRKKEPINSSARLAQIISSVKKRRGKIHPATLTFQALRIAVNNELEKLPIFLPQAIKLLKKGGRLGVISFHSLEDRLLKQYFRREACFGAKYQIASTQASHACLCLCGEDVKRPPSITLVNKKVIKPKWQEVVRNKRARSAKLRVVEKI